MNELESLPAAPAHRLTDAADIHSHPLPAIDDGATSLRNSLLMAALAARYGTTLMVATPHRYYDDRENTPDLIRRLVAETQTALRATKFGSRFTLVAGQEIPLTPYTARELRQGDALTLGDTGVYALVEPAFEFLPDWTADALAAIVEAGFRPVLAHPERNAVIQRDPERILELTRTGALMQLTAMSVTGANGRRAQATAHWILERGLAAAVASDCHSPTWRPPSLRGAYHALTARYGEETARRLCASNPRAIATGLVFDCLSWRPIKTSSSNLPSP